MAGIAPKLPLQLNSEDGIGLTKSLKETIKQNLKMLILTAPGERLMLPDYGVGLRNYLFEQNLSSVRADLSNAIVNQTSIYMPFLSVLSVDFRKSETNPQILFTTVSYVIPSSTTIESLDIEIEADFSY